MIWMRNLLGMLALWLPLAGQAAQPIPESMPPTGPYQGPRMAPPAGGMMAPARPPQGMGSGMMLTPPPPPFAGVQFTPEQQQRINAMMEQERVAHQERLGRMHRSQQKLQQLYQAEIWDPRAITSAYDEIFAEQRKTVEAMAKARNRVYELMTPEQRQQMRQFQPPPIAPPVPQQ